MKLNQNIMLAAALISLTVEVNAASTVTYSYYTATGQSDTSWVAVTGYQSIVAGNAGGASTTFGTVTWGAMTVGSLETSANSVTINYSAPGIAWAIPNGTFYAGGPSLLTNGAYSSTLQQSGVDYMITLSGLTVGKDYKVQFVLADNRDNTGYATILSKGGNVTGDSAETLYSYTDGKFAVITASFNADATTAQFQPGQKWGGGGSDATFVSGVQVLAIPEPSTALLGGLGLLALLRRRR